MGLGWYERIVVKAVWRKYMNAENTKRWAPLIGGVIVVRGVVLRMFGQGDIAATVESVGSVLGLTAASPISGKDAASNIGALVAGALYFYGVFRKIKSTVAIEIGGGYADRGRSGGKCNWRIK